MYKKAFFQILLISVALTLIHVGINSFFKGVSYFDVITIHLILFGLTFGGCALLIATSTYDPNKIGFAFLAVSTIKLLISASMMLIMVKGLGKPKVIAVHFSAIYFFYIAYLSFYTFQLLGKNNKT